MESFPDFQAKFFPEVAAAQAADSDVNPYCSYSSQKLSAFTSVLFLAGECISLMAFLICMMQMLIMNLSVSAWFGVGRVTAQLRVSADAAHTLLSAIGKPFIQVVNIVQALSSVSSATPFRRLVAESLS